MVRNLTPVSKMAHRAECDGSLRYGAPGVDSLMTCRKCGKTVDIYK